MASNPKRMERLSLAFSMLPAFGLFGYSLLLHYGKGGSWALPTFLALALVMVTVGFVLGLRAQRAPN